MLQENGELLAHYQEKSQESGGQLPESPAPPPTSPTQDKLFVLSRIEDTCCGEGPYTEPRIFVDWQDAKAALRKESGELIREYSSCHLPSRGEEYLKEDLEALMRGEPGAEENFALYIERNGRKYVHLDSHGSEIEMEEEKDTWYNTIESWCESRKEGESGSLSKVHPWWVLYTLQLVYRAG